MEKKVKIGDKIPVSIKLEFEGTIRNHAIFIENQFIPTINNERTDFEVVLNGDPIKIEGRFTGVKESVIKKFEVKINGKTGFKISDVKFKFEEIEIQLPVNYEKFDLVQIK